MLPFDHAYINFYTFFDLLNDIQKFPERIHEYPVYKLMSFTLRICNVPPNRVILPCRFTIYRTYVGVSIIYPKINVPLHFYRHLFVLKYF